jgi:signal transduction histidine kinase
MPEGRNSKIATVAGITTLTLAIHYGLVVEPIFGHVHWFHALHGRFCYIPIVIAASWFGLRGGLTTAAVISAFIIPYIFRTQLETHQLAGEIVEVVFYFLIAALVGALVEREFRARRKQQEAEIQVERSQKLSLVGQLAAGVAHEIKNPLASIKGAADILVDDRTSSEDKSEFRDILHNEVRRIDSTVSEFLAFARPRETRLERMDLSEIIRVCIKQMSTQSEKEGVSIESNIEHNLIVNGDAEKLHQMALNLVLNAIQASQPGSEVRITLSRHNQSRARLEISDSGAGMSQEEVNRAFEPFYTTKTSGSGLGLAIVKSIVDSHNGDIYLKSAFDKGTVVTVSIPLLMGQE